MANNRRPDGIPAANPETNGPVAANTPSDPYLMTGCGHKTLSHTSPNPVSIRVEVDIDGAGNYQPCQTFSVPAGQTIEHKFPEGFSACWLRVVADKDTTATAQLVYE